MSKRTVVLDHAHITPVRVTRVPWYDLGVPHWVLVRDVGRADDRLALTRALGRRHARSAWVDAEEEVASQLLTELGRRWPTPKLGGLYARLLAIHKILAHGAVVRGQVTYEARRETLRVFRERVSGLDVRAMGPRFALVERGT